MSNVANRTVSSQYMRTDEVSEYLGISPSAVSKLFNVQSYDYSRGGAPCSLYLIDDVLKFDEVNRYSMNKSRLSVNEVAKMAGVDNKSVIKIFKPADTVIRGKRTYRYYEFDDVITRMIEKGLYYDYAKRKIISHLENFIELAEKHLGPGMVPDAVEELEYMRNY